MCMSLVVYLEVRIGIIYRRGLTTSKCKSALLNR